MRAFCLVLLLLTAVSGLRGIGEVEIETLEDEDEFARPEPVFDAPTEESFASRHRTALVWALLVLLLLASVFYLSLPDRSTSLNGHDDTEEMRQRRLRLFAADASNANATQTEELGGAGEEGNEAGSPQTNRGPGGDANQAALRRQREDAQNALDKEAAKVSLTKSQGPASAIKGNSPVKSGLERQRINAQTALSKSTGSTTTSSKPVTAPLKMSTSVRTAAESEAVQRSREHLFFTDVFKVVLASQAHAFPKHTVLPALSIEIERSSGPNVFSFKYMRSVLLEVRALVGPLPYMRYLSKCYRRLSERDTPGEQEQTWRREAQHLVVQQAIFQCRETRAATHGRDDLMLALLQLPSRRTWRLGPFVRAIGGQLSRGPEPADQMMLMFEGALSGASSHMSRLELLDALTMPFSVMQTLLCDEHVALMACHLPSWTASSGSELETRALLGPFFHPSTTSSLKLVNQVWAGDGREGMEVIERRLRTLHNHQLDLTRGMLRNHSAAVPLIQFLKQAAVLNKTKMQMHYDPNHVSSHGFLLNCAAVAARLFLLEQESTKAPVNPMHWIKFGQLGWESMTPICAQEHVASFRLSETTAVSIDDRPQNAIVNDLFFTALSLFGVAAAGGTDQLKKWGERIHALEDQLASIEETRPQWENTVNQAPYVKRIQDLRQDIALVTNYYHSLQMQVMHPDDITAFVQLHNVLFHTLLEMLGPVGVYVDTDEKPCPALLGAYPEFLLSNLIDFLPMAVKAGFKVSQMTVRPMVDCFVRLMATETWLTNRHLRGELAKVLSSLPIEALYGSPTVEKLLAPACAAVWVAVEETGRHDNYWEKIMTRQHVSGLFEKLAGVEWFNRSMLATSENQPYLFTRFVNLLLNDLEFVLDEAFKQLQTIGRIESEMEDRIVWGSQTAEAREQQMSQLQDAIRFAGSGCRFSTVLTKLLSFLVDLSTDALLCPELKDRMACILNFFLRQLVGPRYNELNVRNPSRFKFDPRDLLVRMMHIYLVLGKDERFVVALSKDTRSFHPKEFYGGIQVLNRNNLGSAQERAAFHRLIEAAESSQKTMEEEDPEEFPEDFCCPISAVIMRNPVKLPSGQVVERSAIEQYLLTSETDPFSRQKLTKEMLEPDTELQSKVEAWLAEWRDGQQKNGQ